MTLYQPAGFIPVTSESLADLRQREIDQLGAERVAWIDLVWMFHFGDPPDRE
jgi:hypothetical protein